MIIQIIKLLGRLGLPFICLYMKIFSYYDNKFHKYVNFHLIFTYVYYYKLVKSFSFKFPSIAKKDSGYDSNPLFFLFYIVFKAYFGLSTEFFLILYNNSCAV